MQKVVKWYVVVNDNNMYTRIDESTGKVVKSDMLIPCYLHSSKLKADNLTRYCNENLSGSYHTVPVKGMVIL